jgi:branched-chain amino acid transport system substrate-binding protein
MKVLALAAMLALLGASQALPAEPVKVGVWLPVTGVFGERGLARWNGIKIAEEMSKSETGSPVKLVLADSRSDGFDSVNAMIRLTEVEKVAVIIGELGAGYTTAGSFYARRKGIALIAPYVPRSVTRAENLVFQVRPVGPNQGRIAARFVVQRLNARTAAILCDISDEQSMETARDFRQEFTGTGGQVSELRLKRGDRDFSGQLSQFRKSRPDVVYLPVGHIECALFARQARDLGLDFVLVASEAIQARGFVALGGRSVEGVYSITTSADRQTLTKYGVEFRRRYQEAFGTHPCLDAAGGAEAYFMVLEAVQRAGSADPERIREALSSARNGLRLTVIERPEADGVPTPDVAVLQVKRGKFTPLGEDIKRAAESEENGRKASLLRVQELSSP